jgi:hypothetical protein
LAGSPIQICTGKSWTAANTCTIGVITISQPITIVIYSIITVLYILAGTVFALSNPLAVRVSTAGSLVRNIGTGKRIASISPFITDFARLAGITGGRTVIYRITELITRTELAVIRTISIIWYIYTGIINFIADILCTANTVIAVNRSSSLTGASAVTCLVAITKRTICAGCSSRCVGAVRLAAACGGAVGGPVITGLACIHRSITAYCRLATGISPFITDFARLAGITGGRTVIYRITELITRTELAVIGTVGVVGRIDTGIIHLIA